MKRFSSQSFSTIFVMVTCLTVFTLNAKAGGDIYEIYLNNKLVLKQFVVEPFDLKNLGLSKANANDELVIYYTHCGTAGKGRRILIKDEKGTSLKEYRFANATGSVTGMRILVKEILQLQQKNLNLSLHYSSEQMPKGRTLAFIQAGRKGITYYPFSQKEFYHFTFGLANFL